LTVASIAGKQNDMADVASQSFNNAALLPDIPFLTHFNTRFPLPQALSWKLVPLTPAMSSLVISTLGGKRLPLQLWMTNCKPRIGTAGSSSAPTHAVTHTSSTLTNPSNSNCLLPSLHGSGEATTGADVKSKLKHPKQRSVTWRKPSSWLATPTLADPTATKT
jgi:hypothetical protein